MDFDIKKLNLEEILAFKRFLNKGKTQAKKTSKQKSKSAEKKQQKTKGKKPDTMQKPKAKPLKKSHLDDIEFIG